MTNPNLGAPAADDFPQADLPASDELDPAAPQGSLGQTVERQPTGFTPPYNPAGTHAEGGGAPGGGEPPVSPQAPGGVAGGGTLGELGGEAGGPGNPRGAD